MSIEQENRTVCKCPPTAGFITFDDDTSYDSYVAVEKEVSNTRQAVILAVFIFSKFNFSSKVTWLVILARFRIKNQNDDSGICQIQDFYQKVDQKKSTSDLYRFSNILITRFRCPSAWCCIYFKSDDERLPNDQRRTEWWPSTVTSSNKPLHYDHTNHSGSQCRNDFRRSNGKFLSEFDHF